MNSGPRAAWLVMGLAGLVTWGCLAWLTSPEPAPSRLAPVAQAEASRSPRLAAPSPPLDQPLRTTVAAPEPPKSHPEPTPQSEPELPEEEAPEDPLEWGPCALYLTLVRGPERTPARSHAQLVRLDAPANRSWGRGDQVQAELELQPGGTWIQNLPAGMYRVALWEQPKELLDAKAFMVTGVSTRIELWLPELVEHPVRLLVYDAFGPSAEPLLLLSARPPAGSVGFPEVAWIKPRAPLSGTAFVSDFGAPEMRSPGIPIEAQEGLYTIGHLRAPTRGQAGELTYTLTREGHSQIQVQASADQAAEQTWVATQIPLATLAEAIRLEDGGWPTRAALQLEASCHARAVPADAPLDPRLAAALEVEVHYPDCQPLRFTWSPTDGPLPRQYLVPTPGL